MINSVRGIRALSQRIDPIHFSATMPSTASGAPLTRPHWRQSAMQPAVLSGLFTALCMATVVANGIEACDVEGEETGLPDAGQESGYKTAYDAVSDAAIGAVLTFCAKSGYGYPNYACPMSIDCHFNNALDLIRSTCVTLEAVNTPDGPINQETIYTLLTTSEIGAEYCFQFAGNKSWPNTAIADCLSMTRQPNGEWMGSTSKIVVDPARQAVQIWLTQTEDAICWAVYETPCSTDTFVTSCE